MIRSLGEWTWNLDTPRRPGSEVDKGSKKLGDIFRKESVLTTTVLTHFLRSAKMKNS